MNIDACAVFQRDLCLSVFLQRGCKDVSSLSLGTECPGNTQLLHIAREMRSKMTLPHSKSAGVLAIWNLCFSWGMLCRLAPLTCLPCHRSYHIGWYKLLWCNACRYCKDFLEREAEQSQSKDTMLSAIRNTYKNVKTHNSRVYKAAHLLAFKGTGSAVVGVCTLATCLSSFHCMQPVCTNHHPVHLFIKQ